MAPTLARALAIACFASAVGLAPATASAKPEDDAKQALVLFERGKVAYKEGRFDESVLLLKEAYALKAEPVLLYNIGRAHEAKGQLPEAVEAYKRYLATATSPPDRVEVEAKITALEAKIAETAAAAAAAAAEAERKAKEDRERAEREKNAPPPPGHEPSLVPWIVAGSGAAIVGVGVVFGVLALGKNGDAEDAPSQADAADQRDGAETFALVSTISLIAGGAVLAGGATWGVIDLTSASSEDTGRLELRWQGPGATVNGRF